MLNVCLGIFFFSFVVSPPAARISGTPSGRSPLGDPTARRRRATAARAYFQAESTVLSVGRLSEMSLTTAIDHSRPSFS